MWRHARGSSGRSAHAGRVRRCPSRSAPPTRSEHLRAARRPCGRRLIVGDRNAALRSSGPSGTTALLRVDPDDRWLPRRARCRAPLAGAPRDARADSVGQVPAPPAETIDTAPVLATPRAGLARRRAALAFSSRMACKGVSCRPQHPSRGSPTATLQSRTGPATRRGAERRYPVRAPTSEPTLPSCASGCASLSPTADFPYPTEVAVIRLGDPLENRTNLCVSGRPEIELTGKLRHDSGHAALGRSCDR